MEKLVAEVADVIAQAEDTVCAECADLEAELDAERWDHEQDLETLYTKREVAVMVLEVIRVATGGRQYRPAEKNRLLLKVERELPDKGAIHA